MGNDPANMVDPTGMIAQGSGAIGGSSGVGQDYTYHSTDPKAGYSATMTIAMSGDYSTELDVYYYQEKISEGGGGGAPADNEGGGDGNGKSVAKEESSFTNTSVGKALVYTYDVLNEGATHINNFVDKLNNCLI